jgi:hypothetical protein
MDFNFDGDIWRQQSLPGIPEKIDGFLKPSNDIDLSPIPEPPSPTGGENA